MSALDRTNKWIDLVDFASKYNVSQSTLRRRIRAKTIEFKIDRGKYYLPDSAETLSTAPLFFRTTVHQITPEQHYPSTDFTYKAISLPKMNETVASEEKTFSKKKSQPIINFSLLEKLNFENKQLKEKIAELEMLLSIMETPNS